jgi:membrane-bound ClpP family serine protease
MQKPNRSLVAKVLGLAALALALSTPVMAAGDDRQCSVTFTSGVAGSTASPSSGTCAWSAGATVLMQCDQDVFFNTTTNAQGTVGPATNVDFQVNFSANRDPYIVYLLDNGTGAGSKNISVLGVTASGTCKFAKTNRRKPI